MKRQKIMSSTVSFQKIVCIITMASFLIPEGPIFVGVQS